MKCVEIKVFGKVQGVFYRANTEQKAAELGISGFVKNERDGSVHIRAEGNEDQIEKLIAWCKHGPEKAEVVKLDVKTCELKGFKNFEIRY